MLSFILYLSMISPTITADDNVVKLRWNDLEVIWIKDERFPVYDIVFYFADGSLSDHPGRKGESNLMFSLLTAGTRRFRHKEISDNLEFFGVSQGTNMTHEYSTFFLSGLTKDIIPTVKLVCHLFKDSTFPKREIKKERRRIKNSLEGLVSSHSSLASRAFREISLGSTPFFYPVSGKIKDLNQIGQKSLKRKLQYFNEQVKKRIYLAGPSDVLLIKSIINEECDWRGQGKFVQKTQWNTSNKQVEADVTTTPQIKNDPVIHLITVPKANQAQVRIGRILKKGEFENTPLLSLTSGLLAGGSSSKLMREVRTKRGLTYSIFAFASGQKDFGRMGIFTSTRNESVNEILSVIKETLNLTGLGKFNTNDLERARGYLAGGHYFKFERTDAYLEQLIHLDHVGKKYLEFYNFRNMVAKINKEEVSKNIKEIFNWNQATIMVLGPKSLKKPLSTIGEVKIIPYKKFL